MIKNTKLRYMVLITALGFGLSNAYASSIGANSAPLDPQSIATSVLPSGTIINVHNIKLSHVGNYKDNQSNWMVGDVASEQLGNTYANYLTNCKFIGVRLANEWKQYKIACKYNNSTINMYLQDALSEISTTYYDGDNLKIKLNQPLSVGGYMVMNLNGELDKIIK